MRTAFSCVVDGDPTFYFQSLMLMATLIDRAGVDRRDIHVHLTDSCDGVSEETYEALGVNVMRIEPAADGYRHCNKLKQFLNPALRAYDQIVLCDCDIAFDVNIDADVRHVELGAKIVDLPNPPLPILMAVLDASGLCCMPAIVPTTFFRDGRTYQLTQGRDTHGDFSTLENNCNGGIYVIGGTYFMNLGRRWTQWAEWLTCHAQLLSSWTLHIDQVSFALATWDLRLDVTHLDVLYNCPLHLEGPWPDLLPSAPRVLHFHRCFASNGLIEGTGGTVIRRVVDRANGALERLIGVLGREQPSLYEKITSKRRRWLSELSAS